MPERFDVKVVDDAVVGRCGLRKQGNWWIGSGRSNRVWGCLYAAVGAELCAGGGPGGGGGSPGWRFSWTYLHETLPYFWPFQLLAHTPAGVFHSDIDWMKAEDDDVAPASWFRGRVRAERISSNTPLLVAEMSDDDYVPYVMTIARALMKIS